MTNKLIEAMVELPPTDEWPTFMFGDAPIKVSLRETYARIAWQTYANSREKAETKAALKWCRENGNPHLELMEI